MTRDSAERRVEETWRRYWSEAGPRIASWDAVSAAVLSCLTRELAPLAGKRVLEAGCGTGRISRELALRGARVACLDVAPEALEIARRQVGPALGATYVLASLFDMPRGVLYDAVWNSGVLEHFSEDLQAKALSEMRQVCRPGGVVLVLCPSSLSLLYRLGRCVLERLGRWRYGAEIPQRSLVAAAPEGLVLEREYSIAFLPFLLDADKFVRALRPLCQLLRRLAFTRWGSAVSDALDRGLSRLFAGYLLVSVFRRSKQDPGPDASQTSQPAETGVGRQPDGVGGSVGQRG